VTAAVPEPSSAAAWVAAMRPRTLSAAVLPVTVGTALAARAGAMKPGLAVAALGGAVAIQIATNLVNDAWDFRRGADTSERVGPPRMSQRGLLRPTAVLEGAWLFFGVATLCGVVLVRAGGLPILAAGIASIAAAYLYTGGKYPLAYHGLGELFVLGFFGFIGVGATYFVQARSLTWACALAAVPVGMLGVAMLAVNNLRDVSTDRAARKRTLIVRFGTTFGRGEYVACLLVSFAAPVALFAFGWAGPWVFATFLALPLAVRPTKLVLAADGPALNRALHLTARLQIVFAGLLSCGILL